MSRILLKLDDIKNHGAGNKAYVYIDIGPTFDSVSIAHEGIDLDEISDLKVMINGKQRRVYKTAARLAAINRYWGRPGDADGYFTIWFNAPELAELRQARALGLGTQGMSTLSIEWKNAPDTAPVFEAWANVSDAKPVGQVAIVNEYPFSRSVGGRVVISDIPRDNPGGVLALHFFPDPDEPAVVEHVVVEVNRVPFRDQPRALGALIQTQHGRVPQVILDNADPQVERAVTHVDFILEGDLSTRLHVHGKSTYFVKPTLAAAGALDIVVEELGWAVPEIAARQQAA